MSIEPGTKRMIRAGTCIPCASPISAGVHLANDRRVPCAFENVNGRRVHVADGRSHSVHVIDAGTLKPAGRIGVGRRPWNLALSRDGRWLYTANGLSNDISIADVDARRVVQTIKVGQRPLGDHVDLLTGR